MAMIGTTRYIYFRLSDLNENPVTGRVKSDFAIIFTRDNVNLSEVLTVSEIGSGRYYASYVPRIDGTDYLEIFDLPTDTRIEDVEVIQSPADFLGLSVSIPLNQDYPSAGALTVVQVTSPQTYTLYVFEYADWQLGNQSSSYALGQSALNSDGTWQSTIYVAPGTYTLVVRNGASTVMIAAHLVV